MSECRPVLVLGNDFSLAAAKTSRHLCVALERLGLRAVSRDTRLIRWAVADVERECPSRREPYEGSVVAKWSKFIIDYGIDTVISLDLHWLFSSRLFLDDDQVKQIHSFGSMIFAPIFKPRPCSRSRRIRPLNSSIGPKSATTATGAARLRNFVCSVWSAFSLGPGGLGGISGGRGALH